MGLARLSGFIAGAPRAEGLPGCAPRRRLPAPGEVSGLPRSPPRAQPGAERRGRRRCSAPSRRRPAEEAILWLRARGLAEAPWHRSGCRRGRGDGAAPSRGGGGVVGVFSSPSEEIPCGNKNIGLCACLRGALECGGIGAAGGAEGDICLPGSPRRRELGLQQLPKPAPGLERSWHLCAQTGVFAEKCHHTCLVCCSLYIFITFSTHLNTRLRWTVEEIPHAKLKYVVSGNTFPVTLG